MDSAVQGKHLGGGVRGRGLGAGHTQTRRQPNSLCPLVLVVGTSISFVVPLATLPALAQLAAVPKQVQPTEGTALLIRETSQAQLYNLQVSNQSVHIMPCYCHIITIRVLIRKESALAFKIRSISWRWIISVNQT